MQVAEGRRRTLFALVSAVIVGFSGLASGGCGEPADNPMGLPSLSAVAATSGADGSGSRGAGSAGAGASSTSSPGSGNLTGTAQGYEGGANAELGSLTGTAQGQGTIVQAVVDYMDVRVRIANSWRVDSAELADVAAGRAARSARQRASVMADGERRTVGTYVVNADRVRRSGDRAVVTGCMVDRTSELDAAGQVVVDPPGGRLLTVGLRMRDGRWLVTEVPTRVPPFCRAPAVSS